MLTAQTGDSFHYITVICSSRCGDEINSIVVVAVVVVGR